MHKGALMPYVWIFAGSYLCVFFSVFYFMSRKIARAAEGMRDMGMEQDRIDDFYRTMGGRSVLALLWATLLTGSILGTVGSAIYWLVT